MQTAKKYSFSFWLRLACSVNFANSLCIDNRFNNNYGISIGLQEVAMKFVLIENPRFISFFLRKLFGIKKLEKLED